MDQVTVPQFIENEDRILGPITVRQFVIMFIAALILFMVYKLTDLVAFIFLCIPIGGTAAIFAFFKVNGQPFHFFILHIVQTLKRPSLRIWKKSASKSDLFQRGHVFNGDNDTQDTVHPARKTMSNRKLNDLSLIVDTGGAYMGDRDNKKELF